MNLEKMNIEIADKLSAIAGLEPAFFAEAKSVLVDENLISMAVSRNIRGKGTTGLAVIEVLKHISIITLPYKRLITYTTVKEMLQGDTANMTPGVVGCCERTLRHVLHFLEREGYIIRVVFNWGNMIFYGLNLPFVLDKIMEKVQDVPIPKGTSRYDRRARLIRQQLSRLHAKSNLLRCWQDALYKVDKKNYPLPTEAEKLLEKNLELYGTPEPSAKDATKKDGPYLDLNETDWLQEGDYRQIVFNTNPPGRNQSLTVRL